MARTAVAPILVKTGDLVFWDTFGGLIPARVLDIPAGRDRVTIQLTATRPAYSRGETVSCARRSVVPRSAVYVRSGVYRIAGTPVEFVPTS